MLCVTLLLFHLCQDLIVEKLAASSKKELRSEGLSLAPWLEVELFLHNIVISYFSKTISYSVLSFDLRLYKKVSLLFTLLFNHDRDLHNFVDFCISVMDLKLT